MLDRISSLFREIGFRAQSDGKRLVGPFTIDGNESVLVASVIGEGEDTILNFEVIGLIKPDEIRKSEHVGAFVQYLLAQNWRFTAGSLEMDTDGEVRVLVELPLADADITANQLRLVIQLLGRNGAELLEKGRRVLATGSPEAEEGSDPEMPSQDMIELLLRFKKMAQTAEGRASLRKLKEQDGCPSVVRIMVEAALQQATPDEL